MKGLALDAIREILLIGATPYLVLKNGVM